MSNQTPFPTDVDLLRPNSPIGLMVWRASAPDDNDVWLSIKNDTVKLMFAQGGQLKAGVQFNVDPKQASTHSFADASSVILAGPLFDTFEAIPQNTDERTQLLERFVWMARTHAEDGQLVLSMSAEAVAEAHRFAETERHAKQATRTIQDLGAELFSDPMVVEMAIKTNGLLNGRRS